MSDTKTPANTPAETNKATTKKVDSKRMLKELAKNNTKIKFSDRVKLEIVEDTKHYSKGQIITPHVTFGEVLVKEGIAKKSKI